MFEQEAPKWPWELFNDADSNTIHVGSQRGLSYDSNIGRIRTKENIAVGTLLIGNAKATGGYMIAFES